MPLDEQTSWERWLQCFPHCWHLFTGAPNPAQQCSSPCPPIWHPWQVSSPRWQGSTVNMTRCFAPAQTGRTGWDGAKQWRTWGCSQQRMQGVMPNEWGGVDHLFLSALLTVSSSKTNGKQALPPPCPLLHHYLPNLLQLTSVYWQTMTMNVPHCHSCSNLLISPLPSFPCHQMQVAWIPLVS